MRVYASTVGKWGSMSSLALPRVHLGRRAITIIIMIVRNGTKSESKSEQPTHRDHHSVPSFRQRLLQEAEPYAQALAGPKAVREVVGVTVHHPEAFLRCGMAVVLCGVQFSEVGFSRQRIDRRHVVLDLVHWIPRAPLLRCVRCVKEGGGNFKARACLRTTTWSSIRDASPECSSHCSSRAICCC